MEATTEMGRDPCPECDGRWTEHTNARDRYKEVKCHDCGHEWKEYTGPQCPSCSSNNTTKQTKHAAPHRKTVIVCFGCGHNRARSQRSR